MCMESRVMSKRRGLKASIIIMDECSMRNMTNMLSRFAIGSASLYRQKVAVVDFAEQRQATLLVRGKQCR